MENNIKRIGTLTRHLTHAQISTTSESVERDGKKNANPKRDFLRYEDVVKMDVSTLQSKYGRPREDAVQVNGVNHVAFVCSDMARTVWFWCEVLGMTLVKTIQIGKEGQHFFIDAGPGCCIAYFYFPDAPKKVPGVASVDIEKMLQDGSFATAHGSVNHVAFNVPQEKLREYRKKIKAANVGMVSTILYHSDVDPSGYSSTKDEHTIFESFYFEGPDGEYLEMTSQTLRRFTPEFDIHEVFPEAR